MRILERRFVQAFVQMANEGYEQGWHERNGGNLSYRLTEHEVDSVRDRLLDHGEWHEIGASVPGLAGEFFLVTGTGKFFRNIVVDPEASIALIDTVITGISGIIGSLVEMLNLRSLSHSS